MPDLLARLDLVVDGGYELMVTDFKTSRSRWSEGDVAAAEGQVLLYGTLVRQHFERPVRLQFAVLTKTKQPDLQLHPVTLTPAGVARQRALVHHVWNSIEGSNFYPHPSTMNCPTCPFQTACRAWTG